LTEEIAFLAELTAGKDTRVLGNRGHLSTTGRSYTTLHAASWNVCDLVARHQVLSLVKNLWAAIVGHPTDAGRLTVGLRAERSRRERYAA
jgi:hypothetical protein